MRFNGLDLNLLVVLDALLAERSVTTAAGRLHLSQPATSAALGRLREFFGDELLTVSGRQMLLTQRACMLVEPVRAALAQIETTVLAPPDFAPATCSRRFVIEASDYVTELVLMPLARRIADIAPLATLQFQSRGEVADAALESGLAHVAIVPEIYAVAGHETETLFSDDFVVVGDAGNPAFGAPMTEAAFFGLGHVTAVFGRGRNAAFADMMLPRTDQVRRVEVSVSRLTDALRAVVGTNRITIAHRLLSQHYARLIPIRIAELPLSLPPFREVLQIRRSSQTDPGLQWLRRMLHECVQRPDGVK